MVVVAQLVVWDILENVMKGHPRIICYGYYTYFIHLVKSLFNILLNLFTSFLKIDFNLSCKS